MIDCVPKLHLSSSASSRTSLVISLFFLSCWANTLTAPQHLLPCNSPLRTSITSRKPALSQALPVPQPNSLEGFKSKGTGALSLICHPSSRVCYSADEKPALQLLILDLGLPVRHWCGPSCRRRRCPLQVCEGQRCMHGRPQGQLSLIHLSSGGGKWSIRRSQ